MVCSAIDLIPCQRRNDLAFVKLRSTLALLCALVAGCSGPAAAPVSTPATENSSPPAATSTGPAAVASVPLPYAQIAGRWFESCVLYHDGSVRCWGAIDAARPHEPTPVQLIGVRQIAVAENTVCGVHDDGRVSCALIDPLRQYGEWVHANLRGLGDVAQVAISQERGCAVHTDRSLSCWGSDVPFRRRGFDGPHAPAVVEGVSGVVQVAHTMGETYVLRDNGDLLRFDSDPASLKHSPVQREVAAVASSYGTVCALSSQGVVTCWEDDEPESPEPVSGLPVVTSITVGPSHACAATASGEVYCWGQWRSLRNERWMKTAERVQNARGIQQLAAGIEHTCGLGGDGVVCWGENANGALGSDSDHEPFSARPMQGVPPAESVFRADYATIVVTTAGDVYCAGDWRVCDRGVRGAPRGVGPRKMTGLSGARQVRGFGSLYGELMVVLLQDGTLKDWYGKTPDDRSRHWVDVAVGEHFMCAVEQGGAVYCKGNNGHGQLGNGTTAASDAWLRVDKLGPANALSADRHVVCALLADSRVACWGKGFRSNAAAGRESSEGPSRPVLLPDSAGSIRVLAYDDQGCALSDAGEVRCWDYQAPENWRPDQPPVLVPRAAVYETWTPALDFAGTQPGIRSTIRADGTVASHTAVIGIRDAAALARGGGSCAITKDRSVWCWGSNEKGERGLGPLPDRAIPVEGLDRASSSAKAQAPLVSERSDRALGRGLGRDELLTLVSDHLQKLQSSAAFEHRSSQDRPTLAILPIRNRTGADMSGALSALVPDIETHLVNSGKVAVIDRSPGRDRATDTDTDTMELPQLAAWARKLGARTFLDGALISKSTFSDGKRAVAYTLFLRVVESESGVILFQNWSSLTKTEP